MALEAVTGRAAGLMRDADQVARRMADLIRSSSQASAKEGTAALLETVSGQAAASLAAAAHPLIDRLEGARRQAGARSLGWRWWVVAGAAMTVACLVGGISVWWQTSELASLRAERVEVQQDLDQLKRGVLDLENKGARIRLNSCDGRLCVEIATNQGGAKVEGVWQSQDGRQFVIPTGY